MIKGMDKEVWVYADGKPLCGVEAWEAEHYDSDEEAKKESCEHDFVLIQNPAGDPLVDKYICSKCHEKYERVKYPNVDPRKEEKG